MLAATFLLLQESGFFSWLVEDNEASGWEETAQSWLIASIVIAVICAGLMAAIKFVIKQRAPNIKRRVWSRLRTIIFILVGFSGVLLATFLVWYSSPDFVNIVGVAGLLKGILFSWLLYTVGMLIWHSFGEWRRDIF